MTTKFNIKEDVKISNNGGFFCQACICGRPEEERSKDERYCLECYDILKGEYGTEVPKNKKEEKKVKKQEALDLVTELGEGYETRSNDGHFDVVEKATGKKVDLREKTKTELLDKISQLPLVTEVTIKEIPQTNGNLTLKEVAQALSVDLGEIYQLTYDKSITPNKVGKRYYFTPEDVEKVKQLLKK